MEVHPIQRMAWARVNPKSTPPQDTEKKQHSSVEGIWRKLLYQADGRKEGSCKGYKQHAQQ